MSMVTSAIAENMIRHSLCRIDVSADGECPQRAMDELPEIVVIDQIVAIVVISWLVRNKITHMISDFQTLMAHDWWTRFFAGRKSAFVAKFTSTI